MSYLSQDIACYIISLGCYKNQTDSEILNGALQGAGFIAADDVESADIVIINTCGFIEDAKRESLQEIFDVEKNDCSDKSTGFRKRLVVCGCLSKRYFDQMKDEMPEIDLLYGLIDEKLLYEIAEKFDIKIQSSSENVRVPLIGNLPYEFIKIGEGCSNNCSYCAIPLIRGPRISYSPEKIIADAGAAVARGASELILIAQDTASYIYNGMNLSELLYRFSELSPGLLRIMYMHPDHVTQDVLDAMRELPFIAPYLDLPFQHADAGILKSMNRSGSAEKYLELIHRIRETVPGISIRSTFMVGYPGEDTRSFNTLCRFIRDARLDRAGFFMYSREEGTAAYPLGDITQKTKIARFNSISVIQEQITREKLSERIDERIRVIVEEKESEDTWIGRSVYDAPEIDGVFFLTGKGELLNKIVEATVTDTAEFDLVGEL